MRVVVHRMPESEDCEGGFEAVATTGGPQGFSVTVSVPDSAENAPNHLLYGLQALFGFTGRVFIEDAAYIGGVRQYEAEGADL